MLRQAHAEKLYAQHEVLAQIGARFRVKLDVPPWKTDKQVGEFLLK